jgi:hypothetical protein
VDVGRHLCAIKINGDRTTRRAESYPARRLSACSRERAGPVSRRVNKTGNADDDPTLIDEVAA